MLKIKVKILVVSFELQCRVSRDTATLIDIVATFHQQCVLKTIVCGNYMSDHDLVKNCD